MIMTMYELSVLWLGHYLAAELVLLPLLSVEPQHLLVHLVHPIVQQANLQDDDLILTCFSYKMAPGRL